MITLRLPLRTPHRRTRALRGRPARPASTMDGVDQHDAERPPDPGERTAPREPDADPRRAPADPQDPPADPDEPLNPA